MRFGLVLISVVNGSESEIPARTTGGPSGPSGFRRTASGLAVEIPRRTVQTTSSPLTPQGPRLRSSLETTDPRASPQTTLVLGEDDETTVVFDIVEGRTPRLESPHGSGPLSAPYAFARSASDLFGPVTSAVRSTSFGAVSPEFSGLSNPRPRSALSGSGQFTNWYFSVLGMSPLFPMAVASRRFEDLVGLDRSERDSFKHCAAPLSVAYSAANEGGLGSDLELPRELHDWVSGIVLNRGIFPDVAACLENLGQLSIFTEIADLVHLVNCFAVVDSAIADESHVRNLPALDDAIAEICALYGSSRGGCAFSPEREGAGSSSSDLQTRAWKSNPALSAVVEWKASGGGPSPSTWEVSPGAEFTTRFESVLHLQPRSPADFESLRALWFVHSGEYRRKIRAKLIQHNSIFSWFQWDQFPEPLDDGETVLFKSMNSETNIFYQSEFYFPEILTQDFLFHPDVEVISKEFLMYPHKVYFGVGPKLRCLLDALGENLDNLVRRYLTQNPAETSVLLTRSQLEAGAFMDIVYKTPAMILGSRMPARDFDPEPIVRDPASEVANLYPHISWEELKVLWHRLGADWPSHSDSQLGVNCLLLQLSMVATKIGDAPTIVESEMNEGQIRNFDFCLKQYKFVDITILPMFMYFVISRPEKLVSSLIPTRFADLLGHLDNGHLIDRAARLKAAFVVANDQLSMIRTTDGRPLAQTPTPAWYADQVLKRPRLADIFQDYFFPVSVSSPELRDKLAELLDQRVGTEGYRIAWASFRETLDSSGGALNDGLTVYSQTLNWFYEDLPRAYPGITTHVMVFEIFDKDFLSLLHAPVNRSSLEAWKSFKESSDTYRRRDSLSPEMKSIINVVEWYFDAYADGYWLDYQYPWFFITNIYGQKFMQVAGDGEAQRMLLADMQGILRDVINVLLESSVPSEIDPEVEAEVDRLVGLCLVNVQYTPPPPPESIESPAQPLKSILFARKIFEEITRKLEASLTERPESGSPTPP